MKAVSPCGTRASAKTWALALGVGAALVLSACGKKEEPAKPAAAPAAASAGKSAAQVAVDAAKPLCQGGKTITIVWEAGLQSLDPKNFSGPKWEKETGCKVNVDRGARRPRCSPRSCRSSVPARARMTR